MFPWIRGSDCWASGTPLVSLKWRNPQPQLTLIIGSHLRSLPTLPMSEAYSLKRDFSPLGPAHESWYQATTALLGSGSFVPVLCTNVQCTGQPVLT